MPVPEARHLIERFELTQMLIDRHLKDLTHAHGLVQPPFQGNCINWVLGHILVSRDEALDLLGSMPVMSHDQLERYRRGSPPVTAGGEDAKHLDELRSLMNDALNRLRARLEGIRAADLEVKAKFREDVAPLRRHVDFLHWHETYHAGQLELLRQVAIQEIPL
jgi:hypothetical protein